MFLLAFIKLALWWFLINIGTALDMLDIFISTVLKHVCVVA